ncbi:hypothetical protein CLU79DRAFT_721411 [Phycomyces nitens]|nr:hypothetical protein CLU79DRAFT_721411 [Phycomyces nitens]
MTLNKGSIESEETFEKGIEYRLKGNASFKQGNYTEAVFSKQDKWDRVIHYATKALELDGKNAKATFRLGQGYLRQGKGDKAKPLLNQALQINPDDPLVKHEIARLEHDEQNAEVKEKAIYRKMFA